jgi:hypothetical protein
MDVVDGLSVGVLREVVDQELVTGVLRAAVDGELGLNRIQAPQVAKGVVVGGSCGTALPEPGNGYPLHRHPKHIISPVTIIGDGHQSVRVFPRAELHGLKRAFQILARLDQALWGQTKGPTGRQAQKKPAPSGLRDTSRIMALEMKTALSRVARGRSSSTVVSKFIKTGCSKELAGYGGHGQCGRAVAKTR